MVVGLVARVGSSRYTLQLSFPKRSAKKALVRVPRCQQHPGSSASLVEQSADDDRDAAAHQTVLQESNGTVTKAADALAAPAHADDAVPQSASEAAEGASAHLGDSLTEPLLKPDDDKAQPAEAAVASVLLENGDEELSLTDGIKRIGSLALPLALQFVAGYGLTIIGAVFIGRLGPEPLSISVLASSFYNVAGLSVALGLSSGMETLCGQAFGAKDYKSLGLVLQRAMLVCWAACVPIVAGLMNSEPLLMHAGQHPEIAAGAAQYLRLLLPCLFTSTAAECLRKYLLAQQVVRPTMIATAMVTAMAPIYYWIFVCKLGLGLTGAAYAYGCCHLTSVTLLSSYVAYRSISMKGKPGNTWGGFSKKAFSGWGEYLSYGVPTAVMICMEWWAYEVLILLAGALPSAQVSLAVMGICLNISTWVYMLPMALGSAVNTWVSNCLGAGKALAARSMFRSGMALVVLLQTIIAGSLVLGGKHVAQVFCSDPAVVAVATQTLPLVGALCFADGLNSVLGAVLRASGRQAWGAGVNLIGYWIIGVPLGAYLGFSQGMAVQGFWLGVGTSAVLQALALGVMVARWDWQGEVRRAQERLASGTFAAAGGH